jgi:hypothetical protein
MNPWPLLAGALRALPPSIRRTLYTVVTAAGAVLAVAQVAGWKTLGPIDVETALKAFAFISSPAGVLALANVKPREVRADADDVGALLGDHLGDFFADRGDRSDPSTDPYDDRFELGDDLRYDDADEASFT